MLGVILQNGTQHIFVSERILLLSVNVNCLQKKNKPKRQILLRTVFSCILGCFVSIRSRFLKNMNDKTVEELNSGGRKARSIKKPRNRKS